MIDLKILREELLTFINDNYNSAGSFCDVKKMDYTVVSSFLNGKNDLEPTTILKISESINLEVNLSMNLKVDFYAKDGNALAYILDDIHIFLYSGEPAAYIFDEAVYTFSGRHIGWYKNHWLRDTNGNCVAFTHLAKGGPARPLMNPKPDKIECKKIPIKKEKKNKTPAPLDTIEWSKKSGSSFFGTVSLLGLWDEVEKVSLTT